MTSGEAALSPLGPTLDALARGEASLPLGRRSFPEEGPGWCISMTAQSIPSQCWACLKRDEQKGDQDKLQLSCCSCFLSSVTHSRFSHGCNPCWHQHEPGPRESEGHLRPGHRALLRSQLLSFSRYRHKWARKPQEALRWVTRVHSDSSWPSCSSSLFSPWCVRHPCRDHGFTHLMAPGYRHTVPRLVMGFL